MYHFLVFCALLIGAFAQDSPTLNLPLGRLEGFNSKSYKGRDYIGFTGIPYALPPVNDLRFADPVDFGKWEGTIIANKSYLCAQVTYTAKPVGGIYIGEENCLYLNVYLPGKKVDPTRKLDVLFIIHAGGFNGGTAQMTNPIFLMDRDVILVTINYRLGILGYLSTNDENMPGNLGMKDQVMALQWTNKYIEYFGGNKDSITIAGYSSGGVSVDFFMMSPLTKGLFHKAISLSGTSLMPWAMQDKPLDKIRRIGEALNCSDKSSTKQLVNCLKSKPLQQLVESIRVLRTFLFNPFSPAGVVVDSASNSPFLPEHPYQMLKKGRIHDVPWITSAVTGEGLFPGVEFLTDPDYLPNLNNNWLKYAPALLDYQDTIPRSRINYVSRQIRENYFGDESVSNNTFNNLIEAISDRLYIAATELAARMHANATNSNVYFYVFDYIGEDRISTTSILAGIDEKLGVCHGDDYLYITSIDGESMPPKLSKRDETVQNFILDMWTSFARNGVPSPFVWRPVKKNANNPFRYLRIGRDGKYEMEYARELGNPRFFDELCFLENKNLFNRRSRCWLLNSIY